MFQFPGFASVAYVIQLQMTPHPRPLLRTSDLSNTQKTTWVRGRVAPFGYLRIKARLSAPRSFSQTTTSFIASCRLGIHHVRLFA